MDMGWRAGEKELEALSVGAGSDRRMTYGDGDCAGTLVCLWQVAPKVVLGASFETM